MNAVIVSIGLSKFGERKGGVGKGLEGVVGGGGEGNRKVGGQAKEK